MKLNSMQIISANCSFSKGKLKRKDTVNSKPSKLASFMHNNLLIKELKKKRLLCVVRKSVSNKLNLPQLNMLKDSNNRLWLNVKPKLKDRLLKLRDKSRSVKKLNRQDKSKQGNKSFKGLNLRDRLNSNAKRLSARDKLLKSRD